MDVETESSALEEQQQELVELTVELTVEHEGAQLQCPSSHFLARACEH